MKFTNEAWEIAKQIALTDKQLLSSAAVNAIAGLAETARNEALSERDERVDGMSDPNTPLRMHIALKILRAWNHGTQGYECLTVNTIWDWIDDGMVGPIPWPDSPFFTEWAVKQGYSNIFGAVGFKARIEVLP